MTAGTPVTYGLILICGLGLRIFFPAEKVKDMAVNMAKHVKGAVEKFLALAKISCEEHGPFPHPDGEQQWVVRERSGKTTINVDEAWTTLTKYMTVEQLSAVVTVGKTALEKSIRASTDKGKQKLVDTFRVSVRSAEGKNLLTPEKKGQQEVEEEEEGRS